MRLFRHVDLPRLGLGLGGAAAWAGISTAVNWYLMKNHLSNNTLTCPTFFMISMGSQLLITATAAAVAIAATTAADQFNRDDKKFN